MGPTSLDTGVNKSDLESLLELEAPLRDIRCRLAEWAMHIHRSYSPIEIVSDVSMPTR
jgi:hypothetical protein